ncbi:MAG: GTP 3',8-cyclase MoaA [Chloroflexota bacterium]
MPGPHDLFNRPINYLRISVTDRCNLRCVYCMPLQGIALFPHGDILTYEEITRIVQAAAELGISKVRLTGGEPLVREGLPKLVSMIKAVPGIDDISLTTNGIYLEKFARPLKGAGLKRVNVSLDSLDAEKFKGLTRGGDLNTALRGIKAANEVGLTPLKVNVVVMRSVNDDEIERFARLTVTDGWHVRFIELMPFVTEEGMRGKFIPISEVRARLQKLGELEASAAPITGNGPAKYYRFSGAAGTIGFISPVSDHFCFSCNRLRLTADGKLWPCLLNDNEIDLRRHMRSGADAETLKQLIQDAIKNKPQKHRLEQDLILQRPMTKLGG